MTGEFDRNYRTERKMRAPGRTNGKAGADRRVYGWRIVGIFRAVVHRRANAFDQLFEIHIVEFGHHALVAVLAFDLELVGHGAQRVTGFGSLRLEIADEIQCDVCLAHRTQRLRDALKGAPELAAPLCRRVHQQDGERFAHAA